MTTATQTTARTTSPRLGSVRRWFTLLAIATSITACGGEALTQGESGGTSQDPGGEQAPLVLSCDSAQRFELSHDTCGAMDAKAIPDSNGQHCYCALGFKWNGKSCEEVDDCACKGADCNKLAKSKEECEKQHAACPSQAPEKPYTCGDDGRFANMHQVCAPMDAKAVGTDDGMHCNCALGFAWNGTSCDFLADCRCEGADCDKLTLDKEECEKLHKACVN